MLLHAYFPAGPGCDGLATGMSQPIFAETLFDEACFCPVLTFVQVYAWWILHDHPSVGIVCTSGSAEDKHHVLFDCHTYCHIQPPFP